MFTPAELTEFKRELPVGDHPGAARHVALGSTGLQFDRPTTEEGVREAYTDRRRTRVHECINANHDGWFALANALFVRLARCRVVTGVYESVVGDATLGEHGDQWYGIIVQVAGSKEWTLRPPGASDTHAITLNEGDVLLLPEGVRHDVRTLEESVHLLFALVTRVPIAQLD